ncbi:unnamed protein product [Mytilus coruscus]|uniref:DZIP3-like HEPN domain-containing protein n=1 Tax=Mytilus coruscus TaxID=42192 RepID=A0A6J8ECL8_MYTCO|nr:unnamed protein product [Mytilus coruscus]
MSTNSPEAQDLLRLFKCVVDTGTDVLTAFAKYKLLPAYNGNFELFLDDKKHEIFHLWQSQKLLCCACPSAGCNLKRMNHMGNWIFKKIYDDSGPENRGHIVRNSRKVVQVCLHKFVTRNIAIDELDISVVSFLLRNLANLSPKETFALDMITTKRSQVCHAYAMTCYPMALLNTAWTELENALLDLADPSYKRIIQKQIKYLRKVDIEKEEITELLKNVEEVNLILQELKSSCNNNSKQFHDMESRLENISINNKDDIKQHFTEQTSLFAAQAQHALSEKIQKTEKKLENSIQHEVKEVKESQTNSFQQLGNQLHETRSEIKEVKENQEKTQVEILRAIQNLTLSLKYERPANLLVPEETGADSKECPVLWQIATPEDWDLEAVVATLRNPSNKDTLFKKKFVRKGSLIMLTTIAASILSDSEAFEAAVISFLTKMIEDCDINTEIPCRVDVTLHILNANEVSISCELPFVQLHQQVSGDKKHLMKNEKFDVAFLNGDDEKEIKWVQNMSTNLKTNYEMKCTILAKDYLNGFPLKSTLGMYVTMFQAVILTLTKENYKQYDFYIKDDMPVIAVELDYLNEIRLNMQSFPYINCTTCEHLWFPRLVDTLKKKIPDHLGEKMEKMENDKNKINEDCEKCKTTVTTAVYHTVEFTDTLYIKQFTICGSIMDETSILNVLHQMKNLAVPYKITGWTKSLETPLGPTTNSLFILISPNIQKCLSLEKYLNAVIVKKGITVYTLKIADTEIPFVLQLKEEMPYHSHLRDHCIDATSMNQKQIAYTIFLLVENDSVDDVEILKSSDTSMKTERSGQSESPMLVVLHRKTNLRTLNLSYRTLDDSVDDIEILKNIDTSMKTERSERSDDSVEDIEILKNIDTRKETERSGRSDDSVDDVEILKSSDTSMKTERSGQSDDSVDDIEILKNIDTSMKTERSERSDDSVEDIEILKNIDTRKETERSGRSAVSDGEIERLKMTNTSMKTERSCPSVGEIRESYEKPNVRMKETRSRRAIGEIRESYEKPNVRMKETRSRRASNVLYINYFITGFINYLHTRKKETHTQENEIKSAAVIVIVNPSAFYSDLFHIPKRKCCTEVKC